MANVLKTYRDLKSKHPDALLLFRCGDFYEVYGDDAKVCAKVLGITLTFRDLGEHIDMAGFPHHALDTYLPKIIRAGHRVAICDMPEPTTKLVRRGSDELTTTATNNSTDNNSKSQETMKLNLSNNKNENQNVQNAQVMNPTTAIVPATPAQDIVDADFEEVKPEPVAEEKPKKKVTIKRKVTLKRKKAEPKSDEPKAELSTLNSQLSTVTFSTYTTKRGDVAPQIIGFGGEDDPRWKAHKDAGHKYVSASYRRDLNGNKVYILLFGVRYMDVAKALCGAYNTADVNAWHRAEDACMAIYEQAQRDGKAKWEAKKAQWAEKKAEKKARKAADTTAAENAEKQVAAMLEKLMTGGDVPESILKHIDPEVLAAFKKTA
jgi:hypothetical protein